MHYYHLWAKIAQHIVYIKRICRTDYSMCWLKFNLKLSAISKAFQTRGTCFLLLLVLMFYFGGTDKVKKRTCFSRNAKTILLPKMFPYRLFGSNLQLKVH